MGVLVKYGHRASIQSDGKKTVSKNNKHETQRNVDPERVVHTYQKVVEKKTTRDGNILYHSMNPQHPAPLSARVPTLRNHLSSTAMRLQGDKSV
jgi:hypothetical protein